MDRETYKKIVELFCNWYRVTSIDSTGTRGKDEKEDLVAYCKEHLEDFKDFAYNTLSHPQECNYRVAQLCDELLDVKFEEEDDGLTLVERILKVSKQITSRESGIWMNANRWLNYFKGTKNIDYYKDWVDYKEYLHRHYIGWNPFNEEDPNPNYKEFVEHREEYKI